MIQKRYLWRIVLLYLIMIGINSLGFAGLNLPQERIQVQIKAKEHKQLKQYFEELDKPPAEFNDTIQQLLIKLLPKPYDKGCTKMVAAWSKDAAKEVSKTVRVVYLKNLPSGVHYIFLVYTCYSNAINYGDRYYDERLALLTITENNSSLIMLPHAKPCDSCSDLSRIGLGDELQLGNQPTINFYFETTNINPFYDGTNSKTEVVVKYFVLGAQEAKEVLTLLKERNEKFHDYIRGDSTSIYKTDILNEKDAKENVIKIDLEYEILGNDISLKQGRMWYTWNNKMKKFEERDR